MYTESVQGFRELVRMVLDVQTIASAQTDDYLEPGDIIKSSFDRTGSESSDTNSGRYVKNWAPGDGSYSSLEPLAQEEPYFDTSEPAGNSGYHNAPQPHSSLSPEYFLAAATAAPAVRGLQPTYDKAKPRDRPLSFQANPMMDNLVEFEEQSTAC